MALQEAAAASSLRGLAEGVATHGLFCSFYNDTGSHRFLMPEAGDRVSKTILTPVDRSLKKLGTVYIAAYSPQARGRSECVFLTLQVRLPKDLKLVGISTLEAANVWLRETYMAAYNARFAIAAEQKGAAFVADAMEAWCEILCIQEDRTVGNDNTVKCQRLSLQLPTSRLRPHFVKASVRVHKYPDGQLVVFWGPLPDDNYDERCASTEAFASPAGLTGLVSSDDRRGR